jgi:uncharacterized protein YbjT (DUF2867 family)
MKKVLITGATGNVGIEVIKSLSTNQRSLKVFAGVRHPGKDQEKLRAFPVQLQTFDFNNLDTYEAALKNCNVLFLLRPPQIANVRKHFEPLLQTAKKQDIEHIVFLSVQGAEKNSFIPHHKIERLILESKIPYTFLRPAYFMQNFTTTLLNDIHQREIFLPAGKAKFTLIDIRDIGTAAAIVLTNHTAHKNKAYDLTSNEKLSFNEMAQLISKGTAQQVRYISPNLFRFFLRKRKEGVSATFIMVMIMLHFLPRFQKEPPTSNCIKKLTGNEPICFERFVIDQMEILKSGHMA